MMGVCFIKWRRREHRPKRMHDGDEVGDEVLWWIVFNLIVHVKAFAWNRYGVNLCVD